MLRPEKNVVGLGLRNLSVGILRVDLRQRRVKCQRLRSKLWLVRKLDLHGSLGL
jgi:hypothetical protein